MKIVCDLDGIVVNLIDAWLDCYNSEYNDKLTVAGVKEWDISLFVKPECGKKIFDYLGYAGFFEVLEPIPGAIKALKQLQDDGHEIVICSATEVPEAAKGKMIWLKKHLPFIPKDNIVFTHGKHHIHGDILIDDSPHNIKKCRSVYGDNTHIIAIAYPWNDVADEDCVRIGTYKHIDLAWMKILGYIAKLEEDSLW